MTVAGVKLIVAESLHTVKRQPARALTSNGCRRTVLPVMAYPLLLHAQHLHHATLPYHALGAWVVPWEFHSFESEYRALRTGVGLIDYSTQALLQVEGTDRASFLQNLLTNDVKTLTPGTGCQAALLTANGKLIADLTVLMDVDALWLLCDATRAATVTQTLNRYLFSEVVTITNYERGHAVFALQGPRAVDALIQLTGTVVAFPHAGDHGLFTIEGIAVRLIRQSLTGGIGALCIVDTAHAKQLWDLIQTKGVRCGVQLVGWNALNTARIEAGIPWFGIDMDEEHLLPETGLESITVSDTKGCYLGQEIIARLAAQGSVSKKLMGLLVSGEEAPEPGDRIFHCSEEAGHVTSACHSPTLRQPIAMGYLKRGAYEPGTAVELLRGESRLAATVAARPLVPG